MAKVCRIEQRAKLYCVQYAWALGHTHTFTCLIGEFRHSLDLHLISSSKNSRTWQLNAVYLRLMNILRSDKITMKRRPKMYLSNYKANQKIVVRLNAHFDVLLLVAKVGKYTLDIYLNSLFYFSHFEITIFKTSTVTDHKVYEIQQYNTNYHFYITRTILLFIINWAIHIILCLISRTTVTTARILEEDACYHARNIINMCVFTSSKSNIGPHWRIIKALAACILWRAQWRHGRSWIETKYRYHPRPLFPHPTSGIM